MAHAHKRIVFRASPIVGAPRASADPATGDGGERRTFDAIGYRQTIKPAAEGGTSNSKGMRVRVEELAARVGTFAGQPFITGHNWSDVRARGGTIVDAWTEERDGEILVYFKVEPLAQWAIEGLDAGTIDRFSWGIELDPEQIVCTVHRGKVFDACFCLPGDMVAIKRNGAKVEVEVEWEILEWSGAELSAVNVPAVGGTGIVEASSTASADDGAGLAAPRAHRLRELSALCGRPHPELAAEQPHTIAPAAEPLSTAIATAASTVAGALTPERVDAFSTALAATLGLAADASAEQLQARVAELAQLDATLREEREREERARVVAHVDGSIARLRTEREVGADVVDRLRATFAADGRSAFDRDLELVRAATKERVRAGFVGSPRAVLQSDTAPARTDRAMLPEDEVPWSTDDVDAWEQHANNESMPMVMRHCGLTPADVRKHGPRAIPVVRGLEQLVADTLKRGG